MISKCAPCVLALNCLLLSDLPKMFLAYFIFYYKDQNFYDQLSKHKENLLLLKCPNLYYKLSWYHHLSYASRGGTEESTCCFQHCCLLSCSSQTGTNLASIWLMFLLKKSSYLFKCIIYIHDPLIILAQVSELQETVCTVPVAAHHITNQSFRWVTENQSSKF